MERRDSHPLWSSGSVPWSVHLHAPKSALAPRNSPGTPGLQGHIQDPTRFVGRNIVPCGVVGCLEEVDVPVELGEGWPGPRGKSPPARGKQARPAGAQGHLCLPLTAAGPLALDLWPGRDWNCKLETPAQTTLSLLVAAGVTALQ